MSRLAKKPILIPAGVAVSLAEQILTVKGPRGTIERPYRQEVAIAVLDKGVLVTTTAKSLLARALVGTYAAHVKNMLAGVTAGFTKKLLLEGVGYKATVAGDKLIFDLGLSHQVPLPVPTTLKVTAEKNVITVSGADKDLVGQFAATIKALKPVEPYKGKGFYYEGEIIRRKQGKKNIA